MKKLCMKHGVPSTPVLRNGSKHCISVLKKKTDSINKIDYKSPKLAQSEKIEYTLGILRRKEEDH